MGIFTKGTIMIFDMNKKFIKRMLTLVWFFFGLYLGPKIDVPEYSWFIVFSPFAIGFIIFVIYGLIKHYQGESFEESQK